MTQTPDFIIVGGGIIGMLTARELAAHGRVTLIERGRTGREASWAGGGILSPLYPWRYADPVNQLARWGQRRYRTLADEIFEASGIDPEYRDSGMLVLDPGPRATVDDWAGRFGMPIEWLDADALRDCEPALNPDLAAQDPGAAWLPTIGQLRNPRLVKSLRGTLDRAGVEVIEDSPVTGLCGDRRSDRRVDNGRVTGVRTANGELSAGNVVIALGSWSGEFADALGLHLPVTPVKGQMVLTRAVPELVQRITLYRGRYVIPRRDGRVVTGSTLEQVGYDKQTTEQAHDELRASAIELVPALANYPVEHHWSGLRPSSPGGIPYIGPHPTRQGLFVNTGQFRNGVVIGYASARLLADHVLQRQPILDPAPYALDAERPEDELI